MKLLVALDPSPAGWATIEQTAARPWPSDTSFEILSVVEATHLWTTSEVAQEAAGRAQDGVRRAVARLGPNATGSVVIGDPRHQILDRARVTGADFIVVGSHSLSPLTRFLVGNVAATVLRHAHCSVAVMRERTHPENAFKILVAVDGSDFSDRAVRSVAGRPWPAGTELRVISAVQLTLPAAHAFFEIPFIESEVVENARAEAMKRALDAVEDAKRMLAPTALPVSDMVSVLFENPRDIILTEAAAWGADLIVLGSHGRHGADLLLLGSVSEGVATHARCSVEVIR
ncbi:MAG TPA: universal stress protein [Bryobacteraceae bacterium]|nr:universal stress protein [Bryobacteraceae bacterium]